MKKQILICLMLSLVPNFKSQERMQMDRPDQTETSSVVPKNYLQIESGYVYAQIKKGESSQQFPGVLTKFGIGKSTELRLITEVNFDISNSIRQNKFQPVTVGFKTALIEHSGFIPDISFLGHLTLFVKNDDGRNRTIPEFKFLFDHEISETFSLGYNLGMEWDNDFNENYVYTLTVAKTLTPKMNAFIEAYGYISPIFRADHRIDGGFTFFFNDNSAADISLGKGLSGNSPSYFLSFGYSFRVDLKKKK